MRELGLVGVNRGLVGSSPSVRTRTVLGTSLSRPENGIAPSARILVLINRVQKVMIHYRLGYDVKANCIPSPRSAELCEPRLVTALSRPERGPEGGNCTGRYARGGRRSSCRIAGLALLLTTKYLYSNRL